MGIARIDIGGQNWEDLEGDYEPEMGNPDVFDRSTEVVPTEVPDLTTHDGDSMRERQKREREKIAIILNILNQ
ncbi:hypothetical protein IPJ72_01180 [Candidatus Peregrinibacteria bacterium]|nr:MAG: hypothetical protein IPJ72_01180 [Candidatus Peregrinibacteria bacterium]